MPSDISVDSTRQKSKNNGRYKPDLTHLVELKEVVKTYVSGSTRFTALRGINLLVDSGEFIAVVGKSGSGKSTLMNMITGIDRPTSGEIYIENVGLNFLSEGKKAVWRGRTIGVVFQFFQLLPTLTVIENIILPMDFCGKYSRRGRRERALLLLEQVELADQANKLPSELSGGQQQRVAIARALANDPPIVVADEPTGNLDSKTAESIFRLFQGLVDDGKTILMVTHDQDLATSVTRTIYLVDGRIVDESTYKDGIVFLQDSTGSSSVVVKTDPYSQQYDSIRRQVAQILDNPSVAAIRLKSELINAPTDHMTADVVYQVIIDEISNRANSAEESGNLDEAQTLWKILVDATE